MKNKFINLLVFLTIIFTNYIAQAKPTIVVSAAPVKAIIAMITKDKIDVVDLNNSGGCPHHYHAKPSDKSLVDNSDMVVYIDDKFDSFISAMITNYHGKKVKISDVSSIDFTGINGQVNWHFWLDLDNVKIFQKFIADHIIETFPEMKGEMEKNLAESLEIIKGIDTWKRSQIFDLPDMILLSNNSEHFFKSLDYSKVKIFDVSNTSLKNIRKLDDTMNDTDMKCIVLDVHQKSEPYLKYKRPIVKLDGETWHEEESHSSQNFFVNQFTDQYLKMIDQLSICVNKPRS